MSDQNSQGSITQWIADVRGGRSIAAIELWNAYYNRLIHMARKKLGQAPRRVADEEDVVLAAFNSFCQGAEKGRFPKLDDRDDLWQVLVMLTARKSANQIKHGMRQKRGGGKVRGESIFANPDTPDGYGIDQVVGTEPTPEFADSVVEECSELLERLGDAILQQVAIAKMHGYTNDEIAEQLNVKARTVERKLKLIRDIWTDESPTYDAG